MCRTVSLNYPKMHLFCKDPLLTFITLGCFIICWQPNLNDPWPSQINLHVPPRKLGRRILKTSGGMAQRSTPLPSLAQHGEVCVAVVWTRKQTQETAGSPMLKSSQFRALHNWNYRLVTRMSWKTETNGCPAVVLLEPAVGLAVHLPVQTLLHWMSASKSYKWQM